MTPEGHCDGRSAPLAEAFARPFDNPQERGAMLCLGVGSGTVVSLRGSVADKSGEQPWQHDTTLSLFSCTRTFTAVAMLQLVAEGKLELDAPVAHYWSELAVAGKAAISMRQLLCHRAGLPALRKQMSPEVPYNWQVMTAALAAEEPWWTPGEAHGYAPITYGWLLGEVIRRVDGREPDEATVARTATPLGLDLHIGLDDSQFGRVAHMARNKGGLGDAATQRMLKTMMSEPLALTTHAFTNPPPILTSTNKPKWRHTQQPAANGHGNARVFAGFYSSLLQGRLLEDELLGQLAHERAVDEGQILLTRARFGFGTTLDQPGVANATYGPGPKAFGHPGVGGSVDFADPECDLTFSFVSNALGPYVLMDPRAQQLARAAGECL